MPLLSNKRKLRNILINPKFQLLFIGYNIWLTGMVVGLFWCASRYWKNQLWLVIAQQGGSIDHPMLQALTEQFSVLDHLTFTISVSIGGIIILSGLYLSHKVAGPLAKLNNRLVSDTRAKRLHQVTFRKGDFFLELADSYSLLAQTISSSEKESAEAKTPVES